jgi:hypothetical protein
MMVEARKVAKLMNPWLTVTVPMERRGGDIEHGRRDAREATRSYNRRDREHSYTQERERYITERSRDRSRERYREREHGRMSQASRRGGGRN